MEPDDPHLIVMCAKSLVTLPYLDQDDICLVKQIISIAIDKAFSDLTVIAVVKKSINIYKAMVRIKE